MNQPANSPSLPSEASLAAVMARRVLDCDEQQPTMSNHQLACQEIRKYRFCPPVNLRPPLVAMTSPALALRDKDFAEKVLTERIEEFSHRFFSIPIAQRKKIWIQLEPRVRPFPQLAWRLNRLKPGLTIYAPVPKEFSRTMDFAQYQCDAFVMSPVAAGNSLRSCFNEMSVGDGKVKEARRALDNFAREYPEIAALHPAGILPFAGRVKRANARPIRNPQEAWNGNIGLLPSMGIIGFAIGVLSILFTYGMPLIGQLNPAHRTEHESAWQAHERSMDARFKQMDEAFSKMQSNSFTFERDLQKRQEEARRERAKRFAEDTKRRDEIRDMVKKQQESWTEDRKARNDLIRRHGQLKLDLDFDVSARNGRGVMPERNKDVP